MKMGVCKFCKKIINELEQVRTGIETSQFIIDDDGLATYNEEDFTSDGDFLEYKCYECGDTLFENWGEAEKFLKDKDELQEIVAEKINQGKDNA